MNLVDVAEEPLVFSSGEKLSKVVSGMQANKAYEAFIVDGRDFKGVVSASDIVKKNIGDLEKAKLSSLSIIRKVGVFPSQVDIREILNLFVVSNYRSVPISSESGLLNLTKLGVLKLMPKNVLHGKVAEDVMFFPECVSMGDSISVVKSILKGAHVYRIAVLNGDKVDGIVDELSMLKTMVNKAKRPGWERGGEKIKEGDIPVSSALFMGEFARAAPGTELKYIVNTMVEKSVNTIVIEEGGQLLGVITPREIIKLLGAEISGVYLTVSGIQDEDAFIKSVVDSEIRNEVKKIAKVVHIHHLTIHVKKFKTTGRRTNFVVRGKMTSHKGLFVADHDSWDLTKSVREMLKRMHREVLKKLGKERVLDRTVFEEEE